MDLSDNGKGSYACVDNIGEVRKLYFEDLGSTLQVISLDDKVQVGFNPAVVACYRQMGDKNRNAADGCGEATA